MRLYRVTATLGDGGTATRFAGTRADASALRRSMAEEHGVRPLADVRVEDADVPTDKAGLLVYLNSLAG